MRAAERLVHRTGVRTLFVGTVSLVIVVFLLLQMLVNGPLLGEYYKWKTNKQLVRALETLSEKQDLDLSAINDVEEENIFVTLFSDTGALRYSSNIVQKDPVTLLIYGEVVKGLRETQAPYFITVQESDSFTGSGALLRQGAAIRLGGYLWDGVVELEVQLEPIHESTVIALRFTLLVGAITALIAVLVFSQITKALTKPIEHITAAAQRIAERDFSQRCDDSYINEIGELAQSINTMSDQLQRYTEELQTANEQLKADIAAIDRVQRARKDLVNNISHDLKTPIALISGYADGLASGMARTPEQVREYCDVIMDESDRMLSMIQRMLQLSRLESGSVTLSPETLCLSDLLDDLLGSFRVEIERAGISLVCDYGPGLYVVSDYVSVEQSLLNYVHNAISHMGEGKQMRVSVTKAPKCRLRISVFNSADPFPAEEITELWDTFYRGEKSRKRIGDRSGLGLAIVKGNMQLLGERFGVENMPGGVEFWLELPEGRPETQAEKGLAL